ncbi:AGC family protein kinase [Anopheles sinensis]|uniref:AGC family protein kinase n=1 Tax=Anopheles sinensis TaxID=74873 RepID=A0A084VFQ1_ANOSI|nr:AGC family protein kinase [Anopheles sinensis]
MSSIFIFPHSTKQQDTGAANQRVPSALRSPIFQPALSSRQGSSFPEWGASGFPPFGLYEDRSSWCFFFTSNPSERVPLSRLCEKEHTVSVEIPLNDPMETPGHSQRRTFSGALLEDKNGSTHARTRSHAGGGGKSHFSPPCVAFAQFTAERPSHVYDWKLFHTENPRRKKAREKGNGQEFGDG